MAIAALEAQAQGLRVAVFDFDVHHGNGTEDILVDVAGVAFASVHQSPCYPGTGTVDVGPNYGFPVGYDVCEGATCTNNIQDGTETGVDCGGATGPEDSGPAAEVAISPAGEERIARERIACEEIVGERVALEHVFHPVLQRFEWIGRKPIRSG